MVRENIYVTITKKNYKNRKYSCILIGKLQRNRLVFKGDFENYNQNKTNTNETNPLIHLIHCRCFHSIHSKH